MIHFQDLPGNVWLALIFNTVIALASWKVKLVDQSGVIAGLAAGILIYIGLGHEGFIILFAFFLVGSLASKFKIKTKEKMGVAQKKGGQRGARHVFANVFVGVCCAIMSILSEPGGRMIYFVGFVASLATALGDTISTELGQLYGKRAYLLITLERVKPGTEGAISMEGTVLGFAASGILAVTAWPLHPLNYEYGLRAVVIVALAAMMANLIESIIGGLFHQFGKESPETLMNFGNTVIGAALAMVWYA